jgi:hypothetical protein
MTKNDIETIKNYLSSRLTEINAEIWEQAGKINYQEQNLSDHEKWKTETRSSTLNTVAYAIESELDLLEKLSEKAEGA